MPSADLRRETDPALPSPPHLIGLYFVLVIPFAGFVKMFHFNVPSGVVFS